jgi:hypothetical protein
VIVCVFVFDVVRVGCGGAGGSSTPGALKAVVGEGLVASLAVLAGTRCCQWVQSSRLTVCVFVCVCVCVCVCPRANTDACGVRVQGRVFMVLEKAVTDLDKIIKSRLRGVMRWACVPCVCIFGASMRVRATAWPRRCAMWTVAGGDVPHSGCVFTAFTRVALPPPTTFVRPCRQRH